MKTFCMSVILVLIFLGSFGCEQNFENHYNIYIRNNSNYNIYCYFYLVWEGGNDGVVYPDTTLSFDKKDLVYIESQKCFFTSRSKKSIPDWVSSLPKDTISIFIFNADTLNTCNWEIIQQDYKMLQRYDLSSEDIKILFNENKEPVIPYPPTEAMKNMKMYPPYEEE